MGVSDQMKRRSDLKRRNSLTFLKKILFRQLFDTLFSLSISL
jgi:hypothetical protein